MSSDYPFDEMHSSIDDVETLVGQGTARDNVAAGVPLATAFRHGATILNSLVTVPPGDTDPNPPGPNDVVFAKPGVFHEPAAGNEQRQIVVTPPVGTYASMEATMELYVSPWKDQLYSDARRCIFWLARNGNGDLFGYPLLLGPGKNLLRFGHGIGMPHGKKHRLQKGFAVAPGDYRVSYFYGGGRVSFELTSADGVRSVKVEGPADVDEIVIKARDWMRFDFGFTGQKPEKEPASIGWQYSNLRVIYRL